MWTIDVEVKELGVVTGRAGLRVESLLETRSEVVVSELGLEALVETGMDVEVLVDNGVVAEVALQLSNLMPLSTLGAVILHTGKSPGLKLQLTFVAIREDSTSCRLDLWLDLYSSSAP